MRRLVLASVLASALAGCFGSSPPTPRDHYYRILVSRPEARPAGPALAGVVSVKPMDADGLLRERPLLFSASGKSHEVQQHDYHYWTEAPTRMLQAQMVAYLRKSGLARSVVTPDMRIRPDFHVMGRVQRLERLLGGGPPRVVAELELALIRLSDNRLMVMDTYAAELPARDATVEASILALNQAVADIFGRFLAAAGRTDRAGGGPRSD